VIDYGAYPDQKLAYYTLRDVKRTLGSVAKGAGLEGAIYAGLEALTERLLGREWRRDDGAAMRAGQLLIDANWGSSTDVVYQFCRQSKHAAVVMPSHGRYVGASGVPFDQYAVKPGDRVGHHWRVPSVRGKRVVRHVLIDTNFWKSFIHARLCVAMGDRGCLSLFGGGADHRMFADHLTAEHRVQTIGRGRTVDEWKLRAGRDNHWLDCLVGCAVGASMAGAALREAQVTRPKRIKVRLSAVQMQKRARQWDATERKWVPRPP
jgi:phage terminase large subunit GpA-like protein